jgi:hypothetical protein
MFFQKVLKGIQGLSRAQADEVFQVGIICNWWRNVNLISPAQIVQKLTLDNLDWHLNHYDDPYPLPGDAPFSENTPFISTTAGVVERDTFAAHNLVFDPFITALQFATRDFTSVGHIFYGYVFTLGRQSIELAEFAEEVRDLNIYKNYMPFHHEGEIAVKIEIRAPRIEKWEEYDGPTAQSELDVGNLPAPILVRDNAIYAPPEKFCNIRGLVTD